MFQGELGPNTSDRVYRKGVRAPVIDLINARKVKDEGDHRVVEYMASRGAIRRMCLGCLNVRSR